MARGFTKRGRGRHVRFRVELDAAERSVLVEIMGQVLDLIGADPALPAPSHPPSGDAFDAIVAGLGHDFGSPPAVGAASGPDSLGGRGFGGPPRDSALDRLFPSANRTDEAAAAEFRRLTENTLRTTKARNLRRTIAVLTDASEDRLDLTQPDALAFLVSLTDVRLVLGDRLGLRDDDDASRLAAAAAQLTGEEPAAYLVAMYDFLTWLQETLATSMLPRRTG